MNKILIILCLITFKYNVEAQMTDEVQLIQTQWDIVNYQMDAGNKEYVINKLAKLATQIVINNPKNAQALIWEGIVYSTYADLSGTLSAVRLSKHAKNSFIQAIKIDGSILKGLAYTSLGVLNYKIPGKPLSFGSDKKAKEFLEKGLEYNPDGIDSNYFFAEFLFAEEENYTLAKKHILKAQNATPRPTRPLADSGRQKEVVELMKKIDKEL